MARIDYWKDMTGNQMMNAMKKKLSKSEQVQCINFILANDDKDFAAFDRVLRNWFIDDVKKPKRHVDMWALVLYVNTEWKKKNDTEAYHCELCRACISSERVNAGYCICESCVEEGGAL